MRCNEGTCRGHARPRQRAGCSVGVVVVPHVGRVSRARRRNRRGGVEVSLGGRRSAYAGRGLGRHAPVTREALGRASQCRPGPRRLRRRPCAGGGVGPSLRQGSGSPDRCFARGRHKTNCMQHAEGAGRLMRGTRKLVLTTAPVACFDDLLVDANPTRAIGRADLDPAAGRYHHRLRDGRHERIRQRGQDGEAGDPPATTIQGSARHREEGSPQALVAAHYSGRTLANR